MASVRFIQATKSQSLRYSPIKPMQPKACGHLRRSCTTVPYQTSMGLLLPAKERSKTFFVGREFDPMKVGVDTTGESGRFLFDTSLIGNSNAGHSFENGSGGGIIGRLLNDDERSALVEYSNRYPRGSANHAVRRPKGSGPGLEGSNIL